MIKVIGAVLLAAWIGMTGAAFAGPDVPGTVAEEAWMGLYMNGSKVGYAMTRVAGENGGYSMTDLMELDLTVMGTDQKISSKNESVVGADLVLKNFNFSLKSGVAQTKMKGEAAGGKLSLDIDSSGHVQHSELPLADPPLASSSIEIFLKRQGFPVGKKFHIPFFDPSMMAQDYMDVEVEAQEEIALGEKLVPVYRVRQSFAGSTYKSWISPELGVLKGEGPMGMTLVKETKEQAMSKSSTGGKLPDIISLFSVKAEGKDIPDPRAVSYLDAKISGSDFSGLQLNGDRQAYGMGMVRISCENTAEMAPVVLPPKLTASARAGQEYLKAEPFVQSDDQDIQAKAREVIGGETDVLKAAKKLSDWVHKSMKRKPSSGIPSATEVLGNLTGDCNEHTVLFTALARSVGIPTRMAAGVVMMDGRLYYHAWPEIYAGAWVAIDPTFGQFPADATHIRLAEGGTDKIARIIKLVGNLKVEVLDWK